MMIRRSILSVLALASLALAARRSSPLLRLEQENWRGILEGEWMIEFYAPWCPACKDLAKAWQAFADWGRDLDINIAEVDVTKNPGLSGRFLVTALPTIYHVKDGVFRLYTGPRDKSEFISFIEDNKWSTLEPIPAWKHPDSPQMSVMAAFFKLSMSVRDAHNYLVDSKSLPPWGSYAIFAGGTLFLGCILGFGIVCLIDCVFPSGVAKVSQEKGKKGAKKADKSDKSTENQDESAANGHANGKGPAKEDKKKK